MKPLRKQDASGENRSVVVIPTYNEAENVPVVLDELMTLPEQVHALVVDDGSPDGTGRCVKTRMQKYPGRISLIEREGKMGLGSAYLRGFDWALERGYAFICSMDADLSHNPADISRLIAPVLEGRADLAVGSRYAEGVRVVNWPLTRLILSYCAGMYTRFVTRLPIRDVTAGFMCYHRRVLEAIDFDRVASNGYSFLLEMKFRAWRQRFVLLEIPIIFTERTEGQSKMTRAIVREAAFKVWELRLRQLFGRL